MGSDSERFAEARRAALGRIASLGASAALPSAVRAAAPIPVRAAAGGDPRRKLVVVMLRGAVDGLSVVVPWADPGYAAARAEIAIAPPGQPDGVIASDGAFGLHPALAPLLPLWDESRLAFVHASGSRDPTRSHFDAQDFMETATPGRRTTPDGWMNRLVAVLGARDRAGESSSATRNGVRGLNLGPSMPRILGGAAPVAAMPVGTAADTGRGALSVTQAAALERMYARDPQAGPAWATLHETRRAMAEADADAGADPGIERGAVPLAALARDAERLGRLMRREDALRVSFFAVGGWDTHANQGGARGLLATRLGVLARALDGLARGLDDRFDDTVVLVVSEFGRTVRQNGTQGTDHGHGNVIGLLGGGVRGGRVHADWPGLHGPALHEGRDLAITTDFRHVIAEVLERHLGLDDRELARVLPDGPGVGRVGRLIDA